MYCVFVFVTPWALARIEAGHTGRLAAVSLALWVAAQIPHPSVTQLLFGLAPPYFDLLAWQLLFLAGLFAGALEPAHTRWIRSRGAVALAVAILLAMEAVRWGGPWGGPKRWPGMDRPTLEALRLLLFFAIAVAFAGLSRHLPRVIARPFEALGRASLPVYAFSVVVCYGSFAYWSRLSRSERAWWVVALILTLYIPALASRAMKSRRWGTPRS
jgi:hypothetical protein